MHYLLDTSPYSFQVTRAAEARKDFGKDVQKVDRETGRPQWVVELLAQDSERGEVIRVTVAGDQPKVNPGQTVRIEGLEAIPWNNNGKYGVAFRATAIHPAQQAARQSLLDLLSYRRSFDPALATAGRPYGLGVAWGGGLHPAGDAEVALCTPDTLHAAVRQIVT